MSQATGESSSPPPPPPPGAEDRSNAQKILAVARALKGEEEPLQISKEVIEKMKYTVFGMDTLFVTSVENYDADGVVFKGNLRAKDPGAAYLKMKARLRVRARGPSASARPRLPCRHVLCICVATFPTSPALDAAQQGIGIAPPVVTQPPSRDCPIIGCARVQHQFK
jgi:hypothetical protein